MTIDEFTERFGNTERRRYLINLLQVEIDAILARGWTFRAFVFGSLVNSVKPEPCDIDVLLCVSKPFEIPRWQQVDQTEGIHIKPCALLPQSDAANRAGPSILRPCHGLEEMVRLFNEGTQKTCENDVVISVSDCVEVTV